MQDSKWAYSLVHTFEQSQFDRKMPEATVLPHLENSSHLKYQKELYRST